MDLIPAGSAPGQDDGIEAKPDGVARVVLMTAGGHAVDVTDAAVRLLWLARQRPPGQRPECAAGPQGGGGKEACPAEIAPLCRHLGQCGCDRVVASAAEVQASEPAVRLAVTVAVPPGAVRWSVWPGLSFEPGLDVRHVAVAETADLCEHLSLHRPQVLMLDADLLDLPGMGSAGWRGARGRPLPVILLSDDPQGDAVDRALSQGFDGVLSMRCPLDTCLRAIHAVARGDLWLPRRALAIAAARLAGGALAEVAAGAGMAPLVASDGRLTGREGEIVDLLRNGLSNKEIARRLSIQEDTVKKHLQHVFAKFGVHRRTQVMLGMGAAAAPTR